MKTENKIFVLMVLNLVVTMAFSVAGMMVYANTDLSVDRLAAQKAAKKVYWVPQTGSPKGFV